MHIAECKNSRADEKKQKKQDEPIKKSNFSVTATLHDG